MDKKRIKLLLYNALSVIENELFTELTTEESKNNIDFLTTQTGITKEELKEINFIKGSKKQCTTRRH